MHEGEHQSRPDGLRLAQSLLRAVEESVPPIQRLLDEVRREITRLLDQETATDRDGELTALRREVVQLREALSSRVVIERAKGILMQEHGIAEDQAFDRLNDLAQRHRRKVRDLAAEIAAQPGQNRPPVPVSQSSGGLSTPG
jgi:ANTAR domain-containing protein